MVKMRRESLSKIMLIRKIDEANREKMKMETKCRSPLTVLSELSPLGRPSPRRKRDSKNCEAGACSPAKLNRLVEEAAEEHEMVVLIMTTQRSDFFQCMHAAEC